MINTLSIPRIENYLERFSQSKPIEEGGQRLSNKKLEMNCNAQQPLINIITVVYNAEATLEETIKSVLAQTYQNIEYIVIDGGSSDRTLSIIKQYESKISYWCSERDRGLYDAINKGISLSTGNLIGIIHAGDSYTPDAVSQIVNTYLQMQSPSILVGNCKQLLKNNSKWYIRSGNSQLLPYDTLPHASVFVPIEIYKNYGLFEISTLKIASDYDFLCRCFTQSVNFIHIDRTIAVASFAGVSSNYYLAAQENLMVHLRHYLSIPRSVGIFIASCITITIHKFLEYIGIWSLVESRRHGSTS
ncbi:MAG: glycosyltransferase [Hydrococcus sp. Prado102]|jgi:glycosyltransferase involved in cell wall biosynthesis|nr:glycosyltransferase [Hydrococcus sp. Prado102]